MTSHPLLQAPGGQDRPLAFWKMLVLGLAGGGLGYMLANGIMPFQAVPFEDIGISPAAAPPILGWALVSIVALIVCLHSGVSGGFRKLASFLGGLGPRFARWLAPHLAAAAADLSRESGSPVVSSPGTPAPAIAAPPEPHATVPTAAAVSAPPEAGKHA